VALPADDSPRLLAWRIDNRYSFIVLLSDSTSVHRGASNGAARRREYGAGAGLVGDRLDILAANAGVSKAASIEDTRIEDFDKLFAVNVRAPFFLMQQLLPVLCKGSNIIFTSSLAAHASGSLGYRPC
jgi:NAD(P)-dependent dehydrogenase (short-subunit alcohol dehydrogenase family)